MKFTEFIVEMDDMPPSQPEKVDKPVPEKSFELEKEKKFKIPEQPRRKKPPGFTPAPRSQPKKVESFPDKVDAHASYTLEDDLMNSSHLKKIIQTDMHEVEDYYDDIGKDYYEKYSEQDLRPYEEGEFKDVPYEKHMERIENQTKDMNVEQMLKHIDFAHKRFVMGSYELNDFFRYGIPKPGTPNGIAHRPHNEPGGNSEFNLTDREYEFYMKLMADTINYDQDYHGHDKLYRGLAGINPFENLEVGQIISDPGFMSTSWDASGTASDFSMDGVFMKLLNADNVPGIDMDFHGNNNQEEIVLPRGTALQFIGKDDPDDYSDNYNFNVLRPNFDEIDKYGNPGKEYDGEDRVDDLGFMESRQPLKLLNKMKDKMKEAFGNRMNDFHFEVLTPEEPEEEIKPEPKKFNDFTSQLDHDD